jgi:hypothetical protein
MPMSALGGLANRDAALSAIGQQPEFFKDIKINESNPQIATWREQHAAGQPLTGLGDTGSFLSFGASKTTNLNPQFFGPIPGRVQAPAPTTAPVALAPTPQPTAVNKTGSSYYKHGGTTPKKKKEEQRGGSVRRALLLSGSGGKLG